MENPPLVSVIVPVYRVEKFIHRCARSLFEQTLEEMEFVFVNDCTPDSSIAILRRIIQEYPKRARQVRIVEHNQNKGSATARNTGLDNAHGSYIIYCDSDDWVEKDMYEKMIKKAFDDKADIVGCDFYYDYVDRVVVQRQNFPSDNKQCIVKLLEGRLHGSMCNKLINRKLYSSGRVRFFDGINMWEDIVAIISLCFYASKIAYVSEPLYHYVQYNSASIVRDVTVKQMDDMIDACRNIEDFFLQNRSFEKFKFHFISLVLNMKFYLVLRKEVRDYDRFHSLWPEFDKNIWRISQRWDICLIYWLASRKKYRLSRFIFKGKEKIRSLILRHE